MKKLSKNLAGRIEDLYASQYLHHEYAPSWYKFIKPLSPTREDVAYQYASKKSGAILDVGCGDGELLIRLSEDFKRLDGVDLVDYRIKKGQSIISKRGIKNIDLKAYDVEQGLPYKSGTFDVVMCLGVIEYTFDPYYLLEEMKRVLKKDGILILEVPNVAFIQQRWKLLLGGLPNVAPAEGWQGGRLHNFTQATLAQALEKTGYVIEKVGGAGFLNAIRALRPSLLSGDLIFYARKK